jgi:hypothetical protein
MDDCARRNPAYRSATERAPSAGPFLCPPRQDPASRAVTQVGVSGIPIPGEGDRQSGKLLSSATSHRTTKSAADAYCPHCHLLIERKVGKLWPRQPLRCPHCRLLVGTGRARPTPSAEPGARGSAAGIFAHKAKRSGATEGVSKEEVGQAIRQVAEDTGQRPERLLMVDYQQRASDDDSLPRLADVFAAYGSWKRARRAAAG